MESSSAIVAFLNMNPNSCSSWLCGAWGGKELAAGILARRLLHLLYRLGVPEVKSLTGLAEGIPLIVLAKQRQRCAAAAWERK